MEKRENQETIVECHESLKNASPTVENFIAIPSKSKKISPPVEHEMIAKFYSCRKCSAAGWAGTTGWAAFHTPAQRRLGVSRQGLQLM